MRSSLHNCNPEATDEWVSQRRKQLEQISDQAELVSFVSQQRDVLAGPPWSLEGIDLMRKYSGLMDITIAWMFDSAVRQAEAAGELPSTSGALHVAVAATGGYGRRELSPHSDIDLVFIDSADEDAGKDSVIRRMFHLIMDVFLNGVKLKVGYSYRQADQCVGLSHENRTALLDMRLLGGNKHLFQNYRSALRQSIDPISFLRRNRLQRKETLTRYGKSPHRVEPNVKEGAGGLRDIHTARWAAQVTFNAPGDQIWDELVRRNALTEADADQMLDALCFLSGVRHLMHITSGRGSDSLTVERREAVAASVDWPDDAPPVDQLMKRYYTHAENVHYLSHKVLRYCDEQRFSIGPGIYALTGRILVESDVISPSSETICQIINCSQRYGLTLAQSARDAVRRAAATDGESLEVTETLPHVLNGPSVSSTLTEMAELGVLQWMLPEFDELMRLLPGDAAHEHTVGEHSLQVVRNLEALRDDEDEEIRGIFAEVKDRRVLFLAGLLHDVGKIESNGDHAQRGCSVAHEIAVRLGMPEDGATCVASLVRHHLLMGDTARLRDLNEPRTINEFVSAVGSADILNMLFLLTLADFSAVGDANWSAVHVRFLRELYHRAARQLTSPTPQDYELDVERHRRRVRRELSLVNLPAAEVDEHSTCMPIAYLLNTSPEDIACHIEYVRQVRSGSPVVELRDDSMSDFTKLTVCAPDDPRPGLLAKIAGALYALDVDIHAAEVFTREDVDRIALDNLYLDFEGCQLPEFKKRQVAADMSDVLTGQTALEDLLRAKNKPLNRPLNVHDMAVLSHVSDKHTVIEISAEDCEGLLFHLTRGISSLDWNIHNARVTTFGGRARDAFYVTDVNGEKLKSGSGRKLRAVLISDQ